MWYDTDFLYRVSVTIDHTLIGSTETNFPVLVNVTLDSSHVTSASGYDIVFTSSADVLLDFDLESYDSGTGTVIAWVKIPTLSSATDTEIYIYYGNSSITTNQSTTSTWSEFGGVWFLNETSGGASAMKDRTSNANHMTTNGSQLTFGVTGKITKALSRNGNTSEVSRAVTASAMNNPSGDIMVMAWIKTNADSQNGNAQVIWEESAGRFRFYTTGSTAWQWRVYKSGGTLDGLQGNTLDQTWQHVAMRVSAADSGDFSYLDGSQTDTSSTVDSYIGTNDTVAVLQSSTASQGADAAISHLMILNADKGADWITTAYTNQDDPGSFYALGTEENVPSSGSWYNASWGYRVKITVDAAEVDATLTNFPVFVDLSDLPAGFQTNVNSDGSDIRVTTDDGTTEVPREVVSYASGVGELHFKAPSLSSSVDTDFYIYYGNSGASDYAVSATYGRNNVWTEDFGFVCHMGGGTLVDSTGQVSDSSTQTGTLFSSGKIGVATDYSGSSQHSIFPDNASMDIITEGTWTMWANADSWATRSMEKSNAYFLLGNFSGAGSNGPLVKPANDVADSGTLSTGVWYMTGARFLFSGTGTLDAIINGVAVDTTTGIAADIDDGGDLYLGSDDAGAYFNGRIDEMRISLVARSDAWLAAEYSNQNSTTGFYAVGSQETQTVAWYNASWGHRVKMTIDSTQVGSDVTDFPVYVRLSDLPAGFHTNVNTDGGDIRITTDDGVTEVPREIVFYDDGADEGEVHTLLDVSSTVDTDFYIYYGNSGASDYAHSAPYGAENVWAAYEAVYHMQEDPSGSAPQILDSTANDRHLTSGGSMTTGDSVQGKLAGKAVDFDNSNDILTGAGADMGSAHTLQLWVYSRTFANYDLLIDSQGTLGSENNQYNLFFDSTAKPNEYGTGFATATSAVSATTWTLLHASFTGGTLSYYQDGVADGTPTLTKPSTTTNYLAIGARTSGGSPSDAILDEIRIRSTALSSAWIAAEQVNQATPATFYSAGSQEDYGGGSLARSFAVIF